MHLLKAVEVSLVKSMLCFMLQKKFLALVNKSHEKVKEREEKKLMGWLTRQYMSSKLKWSKTLGRIDIEQF